MRTTLKRADLFARTALKAATIDVKLDATLETSIYAPALETTDDETRLREVIEQARDKLLNKHQLALDLIAATYTIRGQLSEANAKAGISVHLTQNARLGAEEGRVRAMLKLFESGRQSQKGTEITIARAKAKALRDQPVDRFSTRTDTVALTVLSESDETNLRNELKRIINARMEINDALTVANVSNHITLSDVTVATLRRGNILSE